MDDFVIFSLLFSPSSRNQKMLQQRATPSARKGYQSRASALLTVFTHKSRHGLSSILMEFGKKSFLLMGGARVEIHFLHKLYFRCFSRPSGLFRAPSAASRDASGLQLKRCLREGAIGNLRSCGRLLIEYFFLVCIKKFPALQWSAMLA